LKQDVSISDYFTLFTEAELACGIPSRFTYPFSYTPHPLCVLAARELQDYISNQKEWQHNFGLDEGQDGTVVGKMFGVLIVQNADGLVGYLSAFSGKLAGGNHHARFVPPVFDMLTEGSFINVGMTELSVIIAEIKTLEEMEGDHSAQIESLKQKRRDHSLALQSRLIDSFSFLNQAGEEKNLREIFHFAPNANPPAGAGECALIKLLQFAFLHKMKPLAMAEFFWGVSPKSDAWKHGEYYPSCRDKCEPILGHMLEGIVLDDAPDEV
jgi:tRNA pseudouridine32 synthase/23S rRNA pseudouridine746 synthase